MASLHNSGTVQQQVAHMVVNGNVCNVTHHAAACNCQNPGYHDLSRTQILDDEVLNSLSFPEMIDRRENVASPYKRTCQWIFQLKQYRDWKACSAGLLWIKGKPGAGKSTLMSHLYRQIVTERVDNASSEIVLEFFFSARGVPLERSFLGMLRSLSNQIFRHDINVRDSLRRSYQNKQESFGNCERTWQWQEPELQRLFTDMVLGSAQRQPLIIFVDALDEAGGQVAREISKFFHDLHNIVLDQSVKIKICISSRHYPITSQFPVAEVYVEHHNYDDIASYTQDYFHTILLDSGFNNDEWSALIQELVKMAEGVFQWAHLVLPMVYEWLSEGDSIEGIRSRLSQVPAGLVEVYDHILNQVIEPRHRIRTLRLFQWVCLATRPLSVTELRYALAAMDIVANPLPQLACSDTPDFAKSDEVMVQRIRSWSGGLIEVICRGTLSAPTAQPIHQSVNDFMLTKGFSAFTTPGLRDPKQHTMARDTDRSEADKVVANSHGELYWACLCYIAAERSEVTSETGNNLSLMDYATSHMLVHAQKAQLQRGKSLDQELYLLEYVLPKAYNQFSLANEVMRTHSTAPIHAAAAAGMTDLASYIQQQNGKIHAVDGEGRTALIVAAEYGHLAMVEMLVQMGLDTQSSSRDGRTPLTTAAGAGHVEMFKWLLKQSSDFNKTLLGLDDALVAAAIDGNLVIIKICVAAGANVNYQAIAEFADISGAGYLRYDIGCSALQAVAYRGRTDLVRLLLDEGAHINAQEGCFGNALQAAIIGGEKEVIQLLLDAGADINAWGGVFGSALQAASWRGDYKLARLLLNAGANVNAQGGVFGSALQTASEHGDYELARLLLNAGANVNAQGGIYGNALQAASRYGHYQVVQLLLNAGADTNARGGLYGSALQAASVGSHYEVTKLLFDNGAHENAQ